MGKDKCPCSRLCVETETCCLEETDAVARRMEEGCREMGLGV